MRKIYYVIVVACILGATFWLGSNYQKHDTFLINNDLVVYDTIFQKELNLDEMIGWTINYYISSMRYVLPYDFNNLTIVFVEKTKDFDRTIYNPDINTYYIVCEVRNELMYAKELIVNEAIMAFTNLPDDFFQLKAKDERGLAQHSRDIESSTPNICFSYDEILSLASFSALCSKINYLTALVASIKMQPAKKWKKEKFIMLRDSSRYLVKQTIKIGVFSILIPYFRTEKTNENRLNNLIYNAVVLLCFFVVAILIVHFFAFHNLHSALDQGLKKNDLKIDFWKLLRFKLNNIRYLVFPIAAGKMNERIILFCKNEKFKSERQKAVRSIKRAFIELLAAFNKEADQGADIKSEKKSWQKTLNDAIRKSRNIASINRAEELIRGRVARSETRQFRTRRGEMINYGTGYEKISQKDELLYKINNFAKECSFSFDGSNFSVTKLSEILRIVSVLEAIPGAVKAFFESFDGLYADKEFLAVVSANNRKDIKAKLGLQEAVPAEEVVDNLSLEEDYGNLFSGKIVCVVSLLTKKTQKEKFRSAFEQLGAKDVEFFSAEDNGGLERLVLRNSENILVVVLTGFSKHKATERIRSRFRLLFLPKVGNIERIKEEAIKASKKI